MTLRYVKLIIFSLLAIGIFSCSETESKNPNANGKQVTIALSIPSMGERTPSMTYAMPTDEGKVNTIDVLVFKTDPQFPDDPSKGTYYYRATVAHTAGSTIFTARFLEASVNQTIVVLANSRTEVIDLLGTISEGDSKASVIQALSLKQSTAFDPAAMAGIPMWGEITNQHITATYNPTGLGVKLTRMLAKINIVNNDVANFTLQEAYLYNPRQKGSVMPENWDDSNSSVTTPTLVTEAEMTQGSKFSFLTVSEANKIEHMIYTFEADNKVKAASDRLDATCLVVGGIYQGSSDLHYYRIDLKNYANDEFYNILRNHSYNITIASVTDEGIATPDEAYKGVSRIKASVEVWNEAENEFQYGSDGQLYLSKRYLWVGLDGTSVASYRVNITYIQTSVPIGWKVKTKPEWVILSKMSGPITNSPMNVVFTAPDATTSNPNGREGEVVIQAGDLEYTIYVMQGNCGMNGKPLMQTIGDYPYKTHLYPTGTNGAMQCWMVENSREGIGKSKGYGMDWAGANYGIITDDGDPSYRGSFNGNYYTWAQRDNACPEGWSIPSQTQWNSLKANVEANYKTSDTAVWWMGPRAIPNNAFAGCYEISNDYNGWRNWHKYGSWWTNTPEGSYRTMRTTFIGPSVFWKNYWLSVRCVRD